MVRRTVLVLLVVVAALEGCVYTRANLATHKNGGYGNYPSSIEAEYARRKDRRRKALIAAPLEILGGVALTALALYAPSKPSMSESVAGALGDAGKELLARALLAGLGGALAVSGVGDGILGAVDPAFKSPLVRRGKLVPPESIDDIAPQRGPRMTFHAGSRFGTDGFGPEMGFGLSHWLTPTLRLRHSASADGGFLWGTRDRRLVASGELAFERAGGREHAGLYPRRAIGLYVGGGWAWLEDRPDVPVLRTGLSMTMARGISYRLGTTFARGERPAFDLSIRTELRVD